MGQLEATRRVFSPLLNEEDRSKRARLRAKVVVDQAVDRSAPLMRRIPVDTTGIDPELRFPMATLTEWIAIFQNVFVNAVNAMLDSSTKRIKVVSEKSGREHAVVVLDTG